MSTKSRIQVSVDPYVLQRFDKRVENRSERVESFMKKIAEIEEGKDQDLVERKDELETEMEKLESVIERKKADLASKESELKAVESALEQEEETEEMVESAVKALSERWLKFRKKTHDSDKSTKRLATTREFDNWLSRVKIGKEELKEKVTEKGEEKIS